MVLFNKVKNRMINVIFDGDNVLLEIGSPGITGIKKSLNKSDWDRYLTDKMNSGYVVEDKKTEMKKAGFCHKILEKLALRSRQIVAESYKLSIIPTKEDIQKAKDLLIELSKITDLSTFNEKLLDLFALIPRKMRNPILFTAKNEESFPEILDRENTLLDNLAVNNGNDTDHADEEIRFEECTKEETSKIYDMLDFSTKRKFSKVYRVSNKYSDANFESYLKKTEISKTKLLFHGSKTENWYSIIKTGLNCNPVNVAITGKMFGNGIYFAPKADKANGYTSLSNSKWANGHESCAYMGVFEVATGKEYCTDSWYDKYSTINAMNKKKFIGDCDSFHALAGKYLRFDEVIVYDNDASRIKYLIELTF